MNFPTCCFLAWYLVQGHLAQRLNSSFRVLTICWVSTQESVQQKSFCKGRVFLAIFYINYLVCSLLFSRTLKSIRAHYKLFACSISFGNLKQYDWRDGRQTKAETFFHALFWATQIGFQNFGFSPTNSPLCPGRASNTEDNLWPIKCQGESNQTSLFRGIHSLSTDVRRKFPPVHLARWITGKMRSPSFKRAK